MIGRTSFEFRLRTCGNERISKTLLISEHLVTSDGEAALKAGRDFAVLELYWTFKRYDDALARTQGKPFETWPVGSLAEAYNTLGEMNRQRVRNAE